MAKKKIAKSSEDVVADVPSASKLSASVMKNGQVVRTYSLDLHGKEFEELALQYSKKIGGSIV